jgi:CheY-like chemotaxis protein/HPt (histidine-containing phosphotransfer) domain-containing protein
VVFMDIQMPEMDGIEATRVIRMGETGRAQSPVPIVALTANVLAGDRQAALEAGMDDYLVKPVTSARLEEILNRWVPPGSASPAAEAPTAATSAPSAPAATVPAVAPTTAAAAVPAAAAATTAAPAAEGGVPAADLGILRQLPGVKGDLASPLATRYVSLFVEDAAMQLAGLAAAIDAEDGEAVRCTCHRLKGAAGAVGALALARLARELEDGLKGGAAPSAHRDYPQRMETAFRCYHEAVLAAGVVISPAESEPTGTP